MPTLLNTSSRLLEMGENRSPTIAPLISAPPTIPPGTPAVWAIPINDRPIVLSVPTEVPSRKLVAAVRRKERTSRQRTSTTDSP